jgi:hypothetical protein
MKLLNALETRFPDGLGYSDAVQLCGWIHLAKNTLPSEEGEFAGDKTEIARVFSALAQMGMIRGEGCFETNLHSIMEVKHWIRVIESVYYETDTLNFDFPQQFTDIFPH